MVKHITMWNLKPFAAGNNKDKNYEIIIEEGKKLNEEFGKVRSFEYGRGFKSGGQNYDMVQILTFDSKEDLEEYLKYPGHMKLHEFAVEIRAERAVIDYEC